MKAPILAMSCRLAKFSLSAMIAHMTNSHIKEKIKAWGYHLGFQEVSICSPDVSAYYLKFKSLIKKDYHAGMSYLNRHHDLRKNPEGLLSSLKSIIVVRMDYLPPDPKIISTLRDKQKAYIARYALGRDYHRLMRKRLKQLAEHIEKEYGAFSWRPFADSAPILEKPLAEKAGIGWQGKNTLSINQKAGSYFFLGELFTSLELPVDIPATNHCGQCSACIAICPTQAIRAPYQLDSRRCISYWTIEHKGSIPIDIREKMGNRVFGCDDCQLICPWNKFAKTASEAAFYPRHQLDSATLAALFLWDETTYLKKTEGSAIRRTGYQGWLRNIAIGLGNAPSSTQNKAVLKTRLTHPDPIVREHTQWAYERKVDKHQS